MNHLQLTSYIIREGESFFDSLGASNWVWSAQESSLKFCGKHFRQPWTLEGSGGYWERDQAVPGSWNGCVGVENPPALRPGTWHNGGPQKWWKVKNNDILALSVSVRPLFSGHYLSVFSVLRVVGVISARSRSVIFCVFWTWTMISHGSSMSNMLIFHSQCGEHFFPLE